MEDFVKKHKTPIVVAAGALIALGLYKFVWQNRPKAVTSEKDEQGFILDPKFQENVALYKEEAILRKKLISNVSYVVVLALRKGETFDGQVIITFDVYDEEFGEEDLFVDYQGLGIKDLLLNGNEVEATEAFHGQRIHLHRTGLNLGGTNKLSLTFKSKYRNDGTGCHHFVDTGDNSEYLYTQFEAFHCHRAFPCFDQPDLRASLALKTLSPKEWMVISNGLEQGLIGQDDPLFNESIANVDKLLVEGYLEGFNVQTYNPTPEIAPYLYAFIAGPYDYIEKHEKIPGRSEPLLMRLLFRKTLKKDAERVQDLMYDPVVQGIHWYSDFFGYNYPYEKYDQVFCPEFKFGAMENVGTVTFTENLLYRGKEISERDATVLVNVCLHELCHHWFGDLVTMTWWNDLWLNESFATYVSFLCMSCVPELWKAYPNLWINVNSYKNWGYAEDDLATGHPICKQAPHTDSADDMINGITYGKGCSFLKQLFHLIGYETFSLATKIYFEKYQWKNTVLSDFLGCLDEANNKVEKKTPGIVVSNWAKTFLSTRGANVFSGEWITEGLMVQQEVSEYSDGLRQQKLDVMIFDEKFNEDIETIMTSENEPLTKLVYKDTKKRFFILNHGDHAYGKIIINDSTLEFLNGKLHNLKDPLTRALVWKAIQGMVKTCKLKSTYYFDFARNNIPQEDQKLLMETILTTASMLIGAYIPDSKYEEICSNMFETLYDLISNNAKADFRGDLTSALLKFLKTKKHTDMAIQWLEAGNVCNDKGEEIKGCELNQAHKHTILRVVHSKPSINVTKKQELLTKVVGDDQSDVVINLKLSCEALLPDKAAKEKVWKEIIDYTNKLSSYERLAYMSSFFNIESADILAPYFQKYIDTVKDCASCGDRNFVSAFITNTCPSFNITDDFIAKLKLVVSEFSQDVKHESYCRTVNKVIGSLEQNQKIKEYALR